MEHRNPGSKFHFWSLVLVRTPHSARTFAYSLFATVSALVILLFALPWQQYSTGVGKVIAYAPDERLQIIAAPVDGRIAKWFVAEGSRVKAGDPVVEVSDIDPNILDRLRSELESSVSKLEATKQAAEFSERNLERQRSLAEKGLSSQRTFELAQIEYNKMLSELASATAELARIEVRFSRQSSQVVAAPTDGMVQRLFGASGAVVVKSGDPLVEIAPVNNSRSIELLVEGVDVPLVSIGRKVRIQFEGWPAVQILGWPNLAIGTFGGLVGVIDPSDHEGGRFRVIVFPDPDDRPWPGVEFLRLGVRVQGWVMLDTVGLWFEIWRRFNGFPKSASHLPEAMGIQKTTGFKK